MEDGNQGDGDDIRRHEIRGRQRAGSKLGPAPARGLRGKARLRLVHGMRTGQTRGIEHGRRWRASLEAEARQDGWDEEGGGACADGAEGCWHPKCLRTLPLNSTTKT